jgi:hypothetical protein
MRGHGEREGYGWDERIRRGEIEKEIGDKIFISMSFRLSIN